MGEFLFEGRTLRPLEGESVLQTLLRYGVDIPFRCEVGSCQSCLMRAVGRVPGKAQASVDETIAVLGGFLACQANGSEVDTVERLDPDVIPRTSASLVSMTMATPDVAIVILDAPEFPLVAGKFIQLHHPDGLSRAYSIATPSARHGGRIELHVRLIPDGQMSERLRAAQPGDRYEVAGPFGKCRYHPIDGAEPILLIGSGTGLAPLYGIAGHALEAGHNGAIWLFHGARHSSRLYYRDELATWATRYTNFHYVACTDGAEEIDVAAGSPVDVALRTLGNLASFTVYLCGHPELVERGQRAVFMAGASMRRIYADRFTAS